MIPAEVFVRLLVTFDIDIDNDNETKLMLSNELAPTAHGTYS